jgi:hypothetical protein
MLPPINQAHQTEQVDHKELTKLFYKHSPPWGGKITSLDQNEYLNHNLTNTCSFDYLLYAIWLSFKLSDKVIYLKYYLCECIYFFNYTF